jgi:ankyrin repeat protein
MSNSLPARPNLSHLKSQARDLLKSGAAATLADAQYSIARQYGFPSWPKLKAHIESLELTGQLKDAIDRNDLEAVKALMTAHPDLHRAPMGRGNNGPLTLAAEYRAQGPPPPARLAIARWMLENGSDVHRGGDAPLMRAALRGERVPMMELLVAHGANVNALCGGDYPILFAPCETVDPVALKWLLDHGANPNGPPGHRTTALDYLIGSYFRSPQLGECIDILAAAGGSSRYTVPGVMELLRGRIDLLTQLLDAQPDLPHRRYPSLNFGASGARMLVLSGATLLHVAAEYGNVDAARLLLDRGADVNALSDVYRQSPIFHAVTQSSDSGPAMTKLLVERGADLAIRATLPGHYERPGEMVECTPLGYAIRFPGEDFPGANARIIELLRELGAPE